MLRLNHTGLSQCKHTLSFKCNEKHRELLLCSRYRNSVIYKVTFIRERKTQISLCLTRSVMYKRPLFFLKPKRCKSLTYSKIWSHYWHVTYSYHVNVSIYFKSSPCQLLIEHLSVCKLLLLFFLQIMED